MNFYDFCQIHEKTLWQGFANKDTFLDVYRAQDGTFDFFNVLDDKSKNPNSLYTLARDLDIFKLNKGNIVYNGTSLGTVDNDGAAVKERLKRETVLYNQVEAAVNQSLGQQGQRIGKMTFDSLRIRHKIKYDVNVDIFSALTWTPYRAGRDPNMSPLFHLARGRASTDIAGLRNSYKKDFYSATLFKTTDLIVAANPDLIVYIDSTSDFNRDVLSLLKGLPVQNLRNIKKTAPALLNKKTYTDMIEDVNRNPALRIKEYFVSDIKDGQALTPTGQILVNALQTVLNNLAAGETYEFEGQAVRASSPISRQKTATMITQEWEAAYNAAEENNVPVPAANEEMGLDVGFVKRHLTSYSHFDPKNIRNNQVLDRNKVIVVLDDNINKCSTYAEVNKILKTLDQTKNAQIKWIVGILGTKASKDCFKNAD
jgi:hypothetical protein